MRVAVIGVGGVGAMAAWQLARAGHSVVGFERNAIDHDLGSSYGDSRIVRRVYPDALYTALMADGYALWDDLQARFPDEELFRRAGGVYCGLAGSEPVRAAAAALQAAGVAYEVLDAAGTRRRFPAFAMDDAEAVVYEPSMGWARASRCVCAAVRLAREAGAELRERARVAAIEPRRNGVAIQMESGERSEADAAVVAAGPWSGPLLARLGLQLPLEVTRQPYIHLAPARNAEAFEAGRFPVWIDAEANAYGFPRLGDVPGVKIGIHHRGATVTPESADRELRTEDCHATFEYAARRFPWLSHEVTYRKVCLYTNTPNEDFVVDRVPGAPSIVAVAGLSGHGFKFTPLLGRIAGRLAAGESVPYDLSRFRIGRIASNDQSAPT